METRNSRTERPSNHSRGTACTHGPAFAVRRRPKNSPSHSLAHHHVARPHLFPHRFQRLGHPPRHPLHLLGLRYHKNATARTRHMRGRPADVAQRRHQSPQPRLHAECRLREVVEQVIGIDLARFDGPLHAPAHHRLTRPRCPLAPLGARQRTLNLIIAHLFRALFVKRLVHLARRAPKAGHHQNHITLNRLHALDQLSQPAHNRRPRRITFINKERDIAPQRHRNLAQRLIRHIQAMHLTHRQQHRCRVAASSAQPTARRHALLQSHRHRQRLAHMRLQRAMRPHRKILLHGPVNFPATRCIACPHDLIRTARRLRHRQRVMQCNGVKPRQNRVKPRLHVVCGQRVAHAEHEIDLAVRASCHLPACHTDW